MHVFGQVMIWLIALGAVGASVLTAKTFDVRNSWIKKVDQLKKDVETLEPQIAEKEDRREQLLDSLKQTQIGWDKVWPQVAGSLSPNGSTIVFSTQDQGLLQWASTQGQAAPAAGQPPAAAPSPPVVYLFHDRPDNSTIYIGSYQFDPNSRVFVSTWTVRQSDLDAISPQDASGPFRVRSTVPASFTTRFADIRTSLILTERMHEDRLSDKAEADVRLTDAEARLANRIAELGDVTQGTGVVGQLPLAEDARNQELEELDYWRRQIRLAKIEIENLVDANRELEKQLTKPTSDEVEVTTQVTER